MAARGIAVEKQAAEKLKSEGKLPVTQRESRRTIFLTELAKGFAAAGDGVAAANFAAMCDSPEDQAAAFDTAARILIDAHQFPTARAMAKRGTELAMEKKNVFLDWMAEWLLGNALAVDGDLPDAFAASARSNPSDRKYADEWVARLFVDTRPLDELMPAAQKSTAAHRQQLLGLIATRFAREGKADQAISIAVGLPDEFSSLADIAKILADKGLLNQSLKSAAEIKDATIRARSLTEIAESRLAAGKLAEAKEAVRQAQLAAENARNFTDKSTAYRGVSAVFAQMHDYQRARTMADKCSPSDRLTAYAAILNDYANRSTKPSTRP